MSCIKNNSVFQYVYKPLENKIISVVTVKVAFSHLSNPRNLFFKVTNMIVVDYTSKEESQ